MTYCTDPGCDRHQLIIARRPGGPTTADILLAARIKGCVCTPDIDMPNRAQRREASRRGELAQVDVHHDQLCPLSTNPRLN